MLLIKTLEKMEIRKESHLNEFIKDTEVNFIAVLDTQVVTFKTQNELELRMAYEGFNLNGYNVNHRQRAELQNQPTFDGLCGPMWDDGRIRYESAEVNERMSI